MTFGEYLRDEASGRVGVLIGDDGHYLLLRPLTGGAPWPVHPSVARELRGRERLRAMLCEANYRSRRSSRG